MSRILLFFSVFAFYFSTALGQTKVVSGTVTEVGGETIPGVSVLIKGTKTGTQTDNSGKFTISVNQGAILVFNYIGYKSKEVTVGSQNTLKVNLESNSTELDEVVAIGYATVNRRDLTGSVSSVGAKQLKDIPNNSLAESIAGRLAGVQITVSEGTPNASAQIRVRGGGSITQDNTPLYVVDGIQVENALSVLSPQDIESIDVLKDASATAIYGSRGANGVVLITTKGGREMKTQINYNGLVGFRQLANKLEVMNPYDFVKYQYEASRGNATAESLYAGYYGAFSDLESFRNSQFVDWQEELFGRNALMQTHNVAVTGGDAKSTFNLSVTSNTEDGVMLASDFDRKLINFKFDHKFNNKLKVGFNVRYNNTVVNGAGTSSEGSSSLNRLRQAVKYRPLLVKGQDVYAYDPDYASETNGNSLSLVNPLLLNDAEYKKVLTNVTNFNGYFNYTIYKGLSFKSTLGLDFSNNRTNIFNDIITNESRLVGSSQPIASIGTSNRQTINNSNVISYTNSGSKTEFSKHHSIDALIGQELYQDKLQAYFTENRLFPIGITAERALSNMALGTTPAGAATSSDLTARLFSVFSRLNYSFDKKYLLTLSMRADGSSKFAEGNKWGYFPSGSLAWRISDEKFMENFKTAIRMNDLKLRVSYGEAGNNRIADFLYTTQFRPTAFYDINNTLVTALVAPELANPNLKWETTISRNIGLDAGFLNNRLQFSLDLYSNKTKGLLVNNPFPSTSGYAFQLQNIGSTSNKGIEFQINGTPIQTKNFSWSTNFNISFNKNRVESLGEFQKSFLINSGWAGTNVPADYQVAVGQAVGKMYGLVNDGFYKIEDFNYANGVYTLKPGVPNNSSVTSLTPKPGVIKFKDLNGDGIVDITNDRTIIGDANPKYTGGFNQSFTYKNWDLNVFVNFQVGNDILNANKLEFTSGYTANGNLLATMNGRWRNVNDQGVVVTDPTELAALNANATLWSPLTSNSSFFVNSYAVEDGSFLRINNITLGYTMPSELLKKIKINRMRFYATVNNLAVITNYSGYDPEVNTRRSTGTTPGVDYSAYPRSRAFIFGINFTL
ncbi:TonB-dependent receptor [Pedobacter aquatilis]|uniref:SusC/RagA family TonB-linked outer membrane protein n=1 Tax=Pedobacter aquatilis TaxID=351343 RepID=UPI0025B3F832|nr:TonB-dependent receptor [Pedobacter aquatilis]MDN3587777.1 TonB-dependent receptor [Pedobacter aquatilis]